MRCPFCRHADSRVLDSREQDEGQAIRRRRSCQQCGRRFTTVEEATLSVVKRSGVSEPFSRSKVVNGVRRACQGRPVDEDALALLAQRVEDAVRAGGAAEVPSNEVGLAILGPLRQLDEVAYLRFASVYNAFTSADDFEKAIAELREHADAAVSTSASTAASQHPHERLGRNRHHHRRVDASASSAGLTPAAAPPPVTPHRIHTCVTRHNPARPQPP